MNQGGGRMEEVRPWHENDSFWRRLTPFMFSQQLLSDAAAEVEQVVSLLGIAPGTYILDLCCGVGRHSLELARRGFQVTGVDRTRLYLDRASKQAEVEELRIEFVQDDMRTFCRPDAFDAVINMFTSFGYFEDQEEDHQVAMNVYRSLKSGGVCLSKMLARRKRDVYPI